MPLELRFQFPLVNGLHARPASYLVETVMRFVSDTTLVNERTGRTANAKSVLSMVGADIRRDDPCRVVVSGADEESALSAVSTFLNDVFPRCEDNEAVTAAAGGANGNGAIPVPRSLRAAGLDGHLCGKGVSSGIGWGKVVIVGGLTLSEDLRQQAAGDARHERQRFERAAAALRTATEGKVAVSSHPQEIGVLRAHLAIIGDVALADKVNELIEREHRTAAQATFAAGQFFISALQNSESAYLRDRALDVQDVCAQLVDIIGERSRTRHDALAVRLVEPSICVADHLTPGQFLALDRTMLRGLVLRHGGATSHTVILARSMNVPTVVGVQDALARLVPGQEIIVDADIGVVIERVNELLRAYYRREMRRHQIMDAALLSSPSNQQPAVTSDGSEIDVAANVSSADEVSAAIASGAQGIGLLRTEMLFIDRAVAPSEEEQTVIYSSAARAASGKPIVIRLLDVGGDKPAPYLNLPGEINPFLGYRGVRIYAAHATLIKTQMRAILRAAAAAAHDNIRILVPMVSCVEEVRSVRKMLAEARDELVARGESSPSIPPLGLMLEVPSAAFVLRELCDEADFFSIGSNDLAQYFLAADRDNEKVRTLYRWSQPSFLRLLKQIVDEVRATGKRIGLCGEMAESTAALPLLIGLGLKEISLPAPRVAPIKRAVHAADSERCAQLLGRALRCATRADVESLLEASSEEKNAPMMSPRLFLQSDATTKAGVIKELCDAIWLDGRVQQPHLLEEAIWLREDMYSTGFGFGFAIPHCKSDYLNANTIGIARLATPVDWGSADGKPVDVVIMLGIRAQDHSKKHMRIFSRLSRLVMRDDFRRRVREEADIDQLLMFLEESLGLRAAAA